MTAAARKITLVSKEGGTEDRAQKKRDTEDARTRLIKQNAFLKELFETRGMIALAAKRANVPRRNVYYWLDTNKRFKEKFEDVMEEVKDMIELKGIAFRADNGDHHAASKYLAARAPERGYGRNSFEITGAGGGPLEVRSPTLEEVMEKTDIARLASMLARVLEGDDDED